MYFRLECLMFAWLGPGAQEEHGWMPNMRRAPHVPLTRVSDVCLASGQVLKKST